MKLNFLIYRPRNRLLWLLVFCQSGTYYEWLSPVKYLSCGLSDIIMSGHASLVMVMLGCGKVSWPTAWTVVALLMPIVFFCPRKPSQTTEATATTPTFNVYIYTLRNLKNASSVVNLNVAGVIKTLYSIFTSHLTFLGTFEFDCPNNEGSVFTTLKRWWFVQENHMIIAKS